MWRPLPVLAVTILALSSVVGCAGADTENADESNPEHPVLDRYTDRVDIADFYEFEAVTLDGESVAGADYQGKQLAMWFWAPWCTTCNAEAQSVVRAAREHPDVAFVGVAGNDELGAMHEFVDTYDIEFENLNDTDGSLWRHFGVLAQPAWMFVTANGEYRFVNGSPNESEVEQILNALATA